MGGTLREHHADSRCFSMSLLAGLLTPAAFNFFGGAVPHWPARGLATAVASLAGLG